VVVDIQSEGAGQVVFHQLAQACFAMHVAFWSPDYVVTVGQEACCVGWGVGDDVENVPDVFGGGGRCPLKCEAKGGGRRGYWDVKRSYTLSLGDVRQNRCDFEERSRLP